ncbi:MAG: tetratricopeptide repeat protein [Thermoanaerobaculia bacterium]
MERLNQLRLRWERDPKSRAFLQLAEEYRRGGRLAESVRVLETGLAEHPTYLSAQVALGRCLLESGTPERAIDLLERAVARDPTQLVANKLLVEAYLATGQAGKARERLDLYKLFNDRDVEIEPLESRIRALEASGPPASRAARRVAPPSAGPDEPFDLSPTRSPAPADFALEPGPSGQGTAVAALKRSAASARRGTPRGGISEPFGSVHPAAAGSHIEAALAGEGIFVLAPARVAPGIERSPARESSDSVTGFSSSSNPPNPADDEKGRKAQGLATVPDVQEFANPTGLPFAPPSRAESEPIPAAAPPPFVQAELRTDPFADPEFELEAEASTPPIPATPAIPATTVEMSRTPAPPRAATREAAPASVTLGELYLAQGHFAEAEESFREVLRTRPSDPAALSGLAAVHAQRGDESATFSDGPVAADEPNIIVGGLTARKASLLKDYLSRIRRGAKRRVS